LAEERSGRGASRPRRRGRTGGGSAGRGRGGRRRWGCAAFLLLLLALATAAAAWIGWALAWPYQGYAETERLVDVEPGTGASKALYQLAREGVIADPRIARAWYVLVLHQPRIQAGQYRFAGPITGRQALDKLVRGDVVSRGVTLVEGMTLEEVAAKLAEDGAGRRDAFLDLMRTPEAIADLDPAATDLEGYLFPETYKFRVGTPEREIVATLVRTFRQKLERDVRPLFAGAAAPGVRNVRDLVTLASIVEKEAKIETDRPLIAAVYANRLARHMSLAADPTIIFALKRLGRWDGGLHHDDLQLDSPYNTYRNPGLPPGPICSPGLASLRAAAHPAAVPYLYFVSRNDGSHVFATTLADHNRNVEIWQRQYWRARRAEERRQRDAAGRAGEPR
jgi:UPF0755 protein